MPGQHRFRSRGTRLAALVTAAALVTGACTAGGGDDDGGSAEPTDRSTPTARDYPGLPESLARQSLEWTACPEPSVEQGGGEAPGELPDGTPWQCSTLTVPLDWDDTGGETIEIALIRAVSTADADARIGSLVFNFGGPGSSGVYTLPQAAENYEDLRAGYDLVSFDPRGVGNSAGVVCVDGEQRDRMAQELGGPPRDAGEEALMAELDAEYIAGCEEAAGDLLPHLTTASAARDLDLLRHVLGDGQLHYFGISYGTELGATHASLFPANVGRAVLDAVVDPTTEPTEAGLHQAAGFQLALENWMAHCAAEEGADCPVGTDAEEGSAVIADFLDGLRDRPLPGDGDRLLTADLALTGIILTLYDEEFWPYLTLALDTALNDGEGQLLLAFADLYNGRDEQGRYSNQNDAFTAITCADAPGGPGIEAVEEYREEFLEASPAFGDLMVWSVTGCEGWPVPVGGAGDAGDDGEPGPGADDTTDDTAGRGDNRVDIDAEGAREILLIGTTGDPATPYEGAERMRDALGEGVGVLITREGEGHGAYAMGNECVDEAVNDYLLSGLIPQDGLVCG
ncbi:alpha/beta fold hydrolase [Streptomyces calidiresistens]|uniref:Alpha/beta fold hydrolase n=1 Tax=Streptomyces calidiresistens TaxID=1485586 RepID=A0A7W3XWA0_9ACTN|nr:alpha/beta hydrolase [Streptomyces calidiresistens]MBB0229659.1 alpha/beta fold hydrolase [Streptomyces calidiresistens]